MGKLLAVNCERYLKQISLPRAIMLFLHYGSEQVWGIMVGI